MLSMDPFGTDTPSLAAIDTCAAPPSLLLSLGQVRCLSAVDLTHPAAITSSLPSGQNGAESRPMSKGVYQRLPQTGPVVTPKTPRMMHREVAWSPDWPRVGYLESTVQRRLGLDAAIRLLREKMERGRDWNTTEAPAAADSFQAVHAEPPWRGSGDMLGWPVGPAA